MPQSNYDIEVLVRDGATQRGIPGLRVEAWDKDQIYHDLLGQSVTDIKGVVRFRFNELYYGDHAPDKKPDLFFRVYRGDQLIKTTESAPELNAETSLKQVILEIPQAAAAAGATTSNEKRKDRITADQFIKAVDFARQSDFKGIGTEAFDRSSAALGVFGDLLSAGLGKISFSPVRGPEIRTNQVVGQDVGTATKNLKDDGVEITDTKPYQPSWDTDFAGVLFKSPPVLQRGDQVTLYQKDGKVQYYTTEKASSQTTSLLANRSDTSLQRKVQDLEARLETSQNEVNARSQELEQLRSQVAELRGDREAMLERLTALEKKGTGGQRKR